MTDRYIIGSKTKNQSHHSVSPIPAEHPTMAYALKESSRLSRFDQSKIFIVMKIFAEVEPSDVVIRKY